MEETKKIRDFTDLIAWTKVQNQLIIAKDLRYISDTDYETARKQTVTVHKLISSLIKSLKERLDT